MSEEARIAASYKELKEKFVSGLTGGSVWEVNVVCSIAPAALLFWAVLQSRQNFFSSSSTTPAPLSLAVDILLNIGAILAATTIYADSLGLLHALIILPALALYLTAPASNTRGKKKSLQSKRSDDDRGGSSSLSEFPIRPYLTAYRGGMMLTTVICILAVDFRVFPRRFAKVETWGTSLMDVGVGSFVFSGGIVSAKSILKTRMALADRGVVEGKRGKATDADAAALKADAVKGGTAAKQMGSIARLAKALRASFPLLVLGLIRLYSVKGLDYAEHVTEYGVHWNFFFTLGMLPIGMALVEPILASLPPRVPAHLLLGLCITALHGLALDVDATGLRRWVLTAPRTDLLSQNREGVVSFAGYLAIFLLGIEAGSVMLPREPVAGLGALLSSRRGGAPPSARVHRRNTLLLLAAGASVYGGLAWVLVNPLGKGFNSPSSPVSRRLANPPYVLWIAAFNHLQLFLYVVVETFMFPAVHTAHSPDEERSEARHATSQVLDAYNAGGLAIFLLANLGTGLVNLTLDTLSAGRLKAMGILATYLIACTAVAIGLTRTGLKLKI